MIREVSHVCIMEVKRVTSTYLSLLLTRSHVIFSISLLSSNPTTVAAIRGASGAGAGCSLIGSEQTTSLVPYNCNIERLSLLVVQLDLCKLRFRFCGHRGEKIKY